MIEDGSVLGGAYGSWAACSDSVPGLGVDRVTTTNPCMYQCPMALARTALVLRKTDKDKADRALRGAMFFYEPMVRAWDDNGGDDVPALNAILDVPKILLAEVHLAKATGESKYLEAARRHLKKNLQMLREKVYFDERYVTGGDWSGGYMFSAIPLDFAWAPMEFALQLPADPLTPEVKTVIRAFMEEAIVPLTAQGPFGHAGEWHEKPGLWNGGRYTSSYYNAVAHTAALAAILLKEPRYLDIAERQLQWSCGANVRGVSFMSGIGHKENGIASYVFMMPEAKVKKGARWQLPGLVSKTWDFGTGIVPKVARGKASAPQGCFCVGHITGTVPGQPGASEYTTNHTGNMVLAAATVQRAIRELRSPAH